MIGLLFSNLSKTITPVTLNSTNEELQMRVDSLADDETYVYISFEGAYTIGPRHEDGSRISDEEYDYTKYREYAEMVDRDHEYLEAAKEEFIELCRYH